MNLIYGSYLSVIDSFSTYEGECKLNSLHTLSQTLARVDARDCGISIEKVLLNSPCLQAVRPKEEFLKSQKFKASLWLCEEYPLSLQEQV